MPCPHGAADGVALERAIVYVACLLLKPVGGRWWGDDGESTPTLFGAQAVSGRCDGGSVKELLPPPTDLPDPPPAPARP